MAMRSLMIAAMLAACGGAQQPAGSGIGSAGPAGVASDPRNALEARRDAACEGLGPKLTLCAVADAKADLTAGKVTQQQFDKDTEPGVQRKHTQKFLEQCKVQMSSRQVRVLEVCLKEETDCGPLVDCLSHLSAKQD